MLNKDVQYTLDIFKKVFKNLPPFFPQDESEKITKSLVEMEERYDLTREELEEIFSKFAKIIWPYFQSFNEFHKEYETKMFEKLLEQKLDIDLKNKYILLKELGANKEDLISGSAFHFLEIEEKNKLAVILLDLKEDVRKFIRQLILHKEEKKYKEKIIHYKKQMQEIEESLEDLKVLASQIDFADIILELKEKIKSIENSFLFIAPKINLEEIKKIKEYYLGKIDEKKYR